MVHRFRVIGRGRSTPLGDHKVPSSPVDPFPATPSERSGAPGPPGDGPDRGVRRESPTRDGGGGRTRPGRETPWRQQPHGKVADQSERVEVDLPAEPAPVQAGGREAVRARRPRAARSAPRPRRRRRPRRSHGPARTSCGWRRGRRRPRRGRRSGRRSRRCPGAPTGRWPPGARRGRPRGARHPTGCPAGRSALPPPAAAPTATRRGRLVGTPSGRRRRRPSRGLVASAARSAGCGRGVGPWVDPRLRRTGAVGPRRTAWGQAPAPARLWTKTGSGRIRPERPP